MVKPGNIEEDVFDCDEVECDPTPDGIDALINTEMCGLSLKEREKVIADVHGVAEELHETEELIKSQQILLSEELEKLPGKDAYNKALAIDPKYVQNPDFRLRFLRREDFDAKKAAFCLARHFEYKLSLFGEQYLARDIVQDDLTEEDLDCLYCGYMQPLPTKDRAGRTINTWIPELKPNQSLVNKMRRLFYTIMTMSEDDETQRKGMVLLIYAVRMKLADLADRRTCWHICSLVRALPIKLVGLHVCYDHPSILPIVALGQLAVGTFTRLRMRLHYGNREKAIAALQSFGIPNHALPFNKDGKIDTEQNRLMWENRRAVERAQETIGTVMVPGPRDVLFGRGKVCQEHIGNVRYRYLIENEKERYEKAPKKEKKEISVEILEKIKANGGFFLKDENGKGWKKVEDEVARSKISHCFRAFRASRAGQKPNKAQPRTADIFCDNISSRSSSNFSKRIRVESDIDSILNLDEKTLLHDDICFPDIVF